MDVERIAARFVMPVESEILGIRYRASGLGASRMITKIVAHHLRFRWTGSGLCMYLLVGRCWLHP
jgi:hypothetical protein